MNGKQNLYSLSNKESVKYHLDTESTVGVVRIEKQHLAKVSALKSKVQDYNSDFSKQVICIVTKA